jgi:hypothetical protein
MGGLRGESLDAKVKKPPQLCAAISPGGMHGIVKLRPSDDDASFARLVQLLEHLAGFGDAIFAALDAQPAIA